MQSKAQKAQLRPSLNAQYGWQSIGGNANFHAYQIGVNIPLFYGAQKAKSKAASIEAQSQSEQLAFKEKQIKTYLQQQKLAMDAAAKRWEYYQKTALPIAEKQQKAAVESYELGAIDFNTFTTTFKNAVQTQIEALKAYENFIQSSIIYNYYKN